jgi:hypothetical protein
MINHQVEIIDVLCLLASMYTMSQVSSRWKDYVMHPL